MNWMPTIGTAVFTTFAGLRYLGSFEHHRQNDVVGVYRYPRPITWMIFGGAVFFAAVPFLPGSRGDMSLFDFGGIFWLMASIFLLSGVYYTRYRLILSNTALVLGAHGNKRIPISDMASVEVPDNPGAQICIQLVSGGKIHISQWLVDHHQLGTRLRTLVLAQHRKDQTASGAI